MKIGIIGFGAFGQLAASSLRKKFPVIASDVKDKSRSAKRMGVKWGNMKDACSVDVVLLCVPISKMEEALLEARQHLRPGALVVDACSVKAIPCKLMLRLLPASVEILGTHPLFGPQSSRNGLSGLQITLCPVRLKRETLAKARKVLEEMGLQAIVMTPQKHDRTMAKTQALAHFIAKAIKPMIPANRPRLASFEEIVKAVELVEHDSPKLFRDMETLNPFAGKERTRLINRLISVDGGLNGIS